MKVICSYSVAYIDESTHRDDHYMLSSDFLCSALLLKNFVENNIIEHNLLHDMKFCIVFFASYWFFVFHYDGFLSPRDNVGWSLTE